MSTSGSRVATIRLIGGRPCLDLVNTVSWRGDPSRREDHLRTYADCLTWLRRTALLTPHQRRRVQGLCADDGAPAAELLTSLHRTRDLIAAHLIDPGTPHLEPLTALIRDAMSRCELTSRGGKFQWSPTLTATAPATLIALDLHDMLTRPAGRLSVCQDADCKWAFLDTSRQHNRRWCSSADCGNRHRVRRHHAAQADRCEPVS